MKTDMRVVRGHEDLQRYSLGVVRVIDVIDASRTLVNFDLNI